MERPETLLALRLSGVAVPERALPRPPARMAAGDGRAGMPAWWRPRDEDPPLRRAAASAWRRAEETGGALRGGGLKGFVPAAEGALCGEVRDLPGAPLPAGAALLAGPAHHTDISQEG